MNTPKRYRRLFTHASKIALAVNVALFSQGAFAEEAKTAEADAPEVITVTGSRIKRAELVSSSAVASVEKVQIKLDRAINVEDITAKLPQAAAGANSTGASVGDSFGSSTIDLRGLGQNRTLVLIDGTRATPFSFRNAVDVNAIPAGLIKRVDVLTGGAAAIYGADAVSGVVNFILDDDFNGLELSTSYETADGGNNKFNVEAIFGSDIGDDVGHVTGYVSYSERSALLAGERSFALENSGSMINTGGYYTDVLSGNSFGINDSGAVTSDMQTIDVTGDRFLTQPMERISAGLLYDYDLSDNIVAYGRVMYSQVSVEAAGLRGQTPISVNETVVLTDTNTYIPAEVRDQISFDANGNADVLVNRNLGLGVQYTDSVRDTFQFQFGLKGDITDNLSFDVYAQYGKTDEDAIVQNNAYKNDSNGNSRFGQIANTVDIFDPNLNLSDFSDPIPVTTRTRTQDVFSATLSGNSSGLFELPAGAIEFAVGYEYRDEAGVQKTGEDLGNTFGAGGVSEMDAGFDTSEFFAELLVPVIADTAFAKNLSLEFAYRISDYSNTEADDTYKIGVNWEVNDSIRIRANTLTAFRAPNIGEFAGPSAGIPLSLFDPTSSSFIPRLAGRYNGDPCLDGTGDATQCAAQGAAPVGTPFDSSQAQYSYGGNPDIKPEKAESQTVGVVFTPTAIEGLSFSVDYYNIEITDAVSVIQPAAALQSCYIDNPTPGNSLCGAVTRDPATGLINRTLVNDFNLSFINQSGFDIAANYIFDAPKAMGGTFSLNYQASIVTDQTRQNDSTADVIDCKGTYGSACSGDSASFLQADYKHRATMNWNLDTMSFQLGWRQIGAVDYAVNRSETIDAQDYVDFAASWQATDSVSINVGIDNLFDQQPPTPEVGANHFNTVSDYNVVGRSIGLAIRYTPSF